MSGEPQLERSVLERKERDELHAIAEAVGVRVSARAKKADLIEGILRVTGVEASAPAAASENGAEDRPRRTRARVARAEPVEAQADDQGGSSAPAKAKADPAGDAGGDHDAERPGRGEADRHDADRHDTERHESDGREADGQDHGDHGDDGDDDSRNDRRFDNGAEPGNRRNRRRRGRDRGDRETQTTNGVENPYSGEPVPVAGLLDLRDEGFGFLRTAGFLPSAKDVYVSISQVRRFALRKGDYVEGASRPAATNEKYPALLRIDTVSGLSPDDARGRPRFEDLTPLYPTQRLRAEAAEGPDITGRLVDLLAPFGKGQRGLIVAPRRTGGTTLMKQLALAVEANHPDVHLIVLLVDERPEEVTDLRRSIKGEVVASTFDRPVEEHAQVAELTVERAKRLAEVGKDVVVIVDGLTKLARAYAALPPSGRGGSEASAIHHAKKLFGAGRSLEEGGSVTILATVAGDSGSRLDEALLEELDGTANMHVRLDASLAERRVYPALDVRRTNTAREDLLYPAEQLAQVWRLRRALQALEGSPEAGLELILDKLRATGDNDEFLADIARGAVDAG
ncbi:MAG TPA: transcription termination factor Rho [Acidimicrobiales bacterium]|nr:transcription termination factor Rho [Acidimicrobiales bacterium]